MPAVLESRDRLRKAFYGRNCARPFHPARRSEPAPLPSRPPPRVRPLPIPLRDPRVNTLRVASCNVGVPLPQNSAPPLSVPSSPSLISSSFRRPIFRRMRMMSYRIFPPTFASSHVPAPPYPDCGGSKAVSASCINSISTFPSFPTSAGLKP